MTSPKQKPREWRILKGSVTINGKTTVTMAVELDCGDTYTGDETIRAVEHFAFAALERENEELKNQVSGLQYNYSHAKDNEKELLKQRDELRANLEVAVEALKRECCCPGEKDYNGKDILCDPCEARAKLKDGGG